jgi:hypothetical protein
MKFLGLHEYNAVLQTPTSVVLEAIDLLNEQAESSPGAERAPMGDW